MLKNAADEGVLSQSGEASGSPTAHYALGTRLTATVSSLSAALLVLLLLDPNRIGVFITFANLSAFSAIADLGLTYSFLLATSSRPTKDDARALAGAAVVVLIPIVMGTSGILFAGGAAFMHEGGVPSARWFWPWLGYCVLTGVYQLMLLAVTFLEGTGHRNVAWRAYLAVELASGVTLLLLVTLREELWALPGGVVARICIVVALFAARDEMSGLWAVCSIRRGLLSWRNHLWPMQWKTVLNNLSGLLTTRLLTPFLLASQGPATAGRVGLILSLGIAIIGTTTAWPLSHTALYVSLYHQGRTKELISSFRSTCIRSTALSMLFCIGAGALCEILRLSSPHMAARLPEHGTLWLILAVSPLGHLSASFAIFLRSRRQDPVVFPNLLLALPALISLWLAAHHSTLVFAGVYWLAGLLFMMLYGWHWRRVVADAVSGRIL